MSTFTDLITTVPAPKHTQHTAFHTQLSTHSHILSVPRARPGSKHKAARVFTRSRPQSGSTSRTEIAYALGQRDGFLLHPLAEQLVRCVEHGARRTRSRWCARSRTRCHLAHAHGARAVLSSEDRHESGGQRHPEVHSKFTEVITSVIFVCGATVHRPTATDDNCGRSVVVRLRLP